MHIFLWVVNCSYIGLKFRKDLKNKKYFLIFYWPWAETWMEAQPAMPFLPSLLFTQSLVAAQNYRSRGPAAPTSRSPAALPGFPHTCYRPDTPISTQTRGRPNRFTPFAISP
jgi:hypothetical protein